MGGKHFISKNAEKFPLVPSLLDSLHHGVALMDGDLNLLLVNRRAQELLELPEDLFSTVRTLADVLRFFADRGDYGAGDAGALIEERLAIARECRPHDFDWKRSDGTVVRIQGTPLERGGYLTIYSDVTRERAVERYLAETQSQLEVRLASRTRELEQSRDLLFSAVDAIPDALVMTDADGVVTLANSNMKQLFPDIERHIEQGDHIVDVFALDRVALASDADFFDHIAYESDQRMFGGKWYRIQSSLIPTGGHIVVFSNITDFKKQNATLRAHADQLVKHLRKEKRLNEMQREFVSMASHEFRTPLAIIDGAAQRMMRRIDRLEPEDVAERLERIRTAVGRMQYLIDRFIDSSVAQSGTMEIDRSVQPLDGLLASICRQQEEVNKTHTVEYRSSIDGVLLNIDKRLIEQSIVNVIGNAIKYSPGKNRISVTAEVDGKSVVVKVRDFGVGIPQKEIGKIFGRYFRASTSSGIPGTGIGLNLTEMIIEQHRGHIAVDSVVGEGTTITIRLPIAEEKASSGDEPKKDAAAGRRAGAR